MIGSARGYGCQDETSHTSHWTSNECLHAMIQLIAHPAGVLRHSHNNERVYVGTPSRRLRRTRRDRTAVMVDGDARMTTTTQDVSRSDNRRHFVHFWQ